MDREHADADERLVTIGSIVRLFCTLTVAALFSWRAPGTARDRLGSTNATSVNSSAPTTDGSASAVSDAASASPTDPERWL